MKRETSHSRSSVQFFASPNGSALSEGITKNPASILRVQQLVREAAKSMTTPIEVILEGGTYFLDETLFLTREDSGRDGLQVIWKAKDRNHPPIFSGGRRLENQWELHDERKNIYKLCLKDEDFITRDLYVNGKRCLLARSRNQSIGLEFDTEEAAYEATVEGGSEKVAGLGLKGPVAEVVKSYGDISQLEAVRNVRWRHFEIPVEKVIDDVVYMSAKAWRNASITDRVHYDWNGASWRNYGGGVTYFQNAYGLLDEPGEFFFDKRDRTLYYIPREGEDLETAEVIAPVLEKIMVLEGRDIEQVKTPQPGREKGGIVGEKISHITFDGIIFNHNTFLRPGTKDGYVSTQAGHTLTGPEEKGPFSDPWGSYATPPHAAIYVNSGDHIHFRNCEFSKLGSTALMITKGSRNCVIHKNIFQDLSGGGIYLGDAKHTSDIAPDPFKKGPSFSIDEIVDPAIIPLEEGELSYNNTISHNLVQWTGLQFSDTVAIWAGYEMGLKLVHNTVQHVSYTGINVGWGWRETGRKSRMRNNYIAYNRITDYLRHASDMHDGGGLYMINAQPGTIVEYNYFNNPTGTGNAVYFDAGLDYVILRHNVMTNIHLKWVSANFASMHRGMIAYDNYTEKGYEKNLYSHTFDGEYTIMGDNYIYTKVLPKHALEIARNAGHKAPYDIDEIDLLRFNLAKQKQTRQSTGTDGSHAVDGDLTTTVTIKSDTNPWWEVDLQEVKPLHSIAIHQPTKSMTAECLTDFYVFISSKSFGDQSIAALLMEPKIQKIYIEEISENHSGIALPKDTEGRYVRIQLCEANPLHLAEVEINLNVDSYSIPYLQNVSAYLTTNDSQKNDVSYNVFSDGAEVSSIFIKDTKIPSSYYQVKDQLLVRNAFLDHRKIVNFLSEIGENNKWYSYLQETFTSLKETPTYVEGKNITIKKDPLIGFVDEGENEVIIHFKNGMELKANLHVTS